MKCVKWKGAIETYYCNENLGHYGDPNSKEPVPRCGIENLIQAKLRVN